MRAALDEALVAKTPRPRSMSSFGMDFDEGRGPLFAIALLTLDLDAAAPSLRREAPALYALLAAVRMAQGGAGEASRRAWIARLGGATLVPRIAAFWREHGARFVPEPLVDYARSAEWVAAVHELAPDAAARLLAQWAEAHRLKRNLWREVAQRGLELPPGVSKAPPARNARYR